MKEIIVFAAAILIFIAMTLIAIAYEHDAIMECTRIAIEKGYSASDIRAICE